MAYQYRIQQVTFSDHTSLDLPNLTVLVGPNNCGKSRALKDIVELTCSNQKNVVVVVDARPTIPLNVKEFAASYEIRQSRNSQGNSQFRFLRPTLDKEDNVGYGARLRWPDDFVPHVSSLNGFVQLFAGQLTALLTTEHRLTLVSRKQSPRDLDQAGNLLQVLYASGREEELQVRKNVSEAFPEVEVALDFSVPQLLEFKIGSDFSKLPPDPRDARQILAECERLDEQGDGLRSYVGIVVALTILKRPVVLIDEPEAFLHPPQAFRLGQFIASQASQGHQIIVATHSADVLRGIIFKANDALIARIDRVANKNVVKPLDPEELQRLVLDPLLSAAGVLDGLFYSGVVVTEADADSRFYQSLSSKANPGLDIHFVNADNKQTVPKVLAAYKRLGVRCAGVVDIDVLNDAVEFNKQLEAAGIAGGQLADAKQARQRIDDEARTTPAAARLEMAIKQISEMKALADSALAGDPSGHEKALAQLRRELEKLKADTSEWQHIKKGGAAALKNTRVEFEKLYQMCSAAGLFINPSGVLESSLSEYGVKWRSDNRAWITEALQLVPNLEVNLEKQPWKLISDVHKHLQQPQVAAETSLRQSGNQSVPGPVCRVADGS